MISVCLCIPTLTDATSFYRGMGPFAALRRKHRDIQLTVMSTYNWATLDVADMVFIQRPYLDEHRAIASIAKDCGVPLWVDYDDFLFDVPSDNPTHQIYSNPKHKKNIAEMIAMADAVTVSTQHLADLIKPLRTAAKLEPATVVPNAYNMHKLERLRLPSRERKKLIVWRGSHTHQRDLMEYSSAIIETIKGNPSWTINFLGYNPWWITQAIPEKQWIVTPPLDPFQYHNFLAEVAPEIIIVPLADHNFNRAKSNIAWIEGAFAGAATLAPRWPEWMKPGVEFYGTVAGETSQDIFTSNLQRMINGFEAGENEANANSSWQYIKESLVIDQVNRSRRTIVNSLAGIRK